MVMEVSSHALDQGRCAYVDYDIAVFTNLTRDHLDYHGDMDAYKAAKGKLFQGLQDGERQRAVVNLDDPLAQDFLAYAEAVPASSAAAAANAFPIFRLKVPVGSRTIFLGDPFRNHAELA